MKKLAIVTLVFSFVMMGTINAQSKKTDNKPVAQYIKNNIAPAVKQAQQNFINTLTPAEKVQLEKVKGELKAFREEAKINQDKKAGQFNQQKWVERQQAMKNIMDKAEQIAAAHPDAAKNYSAFIDENAPKWEAEIAKLRQNKTGNGVNRPMNNRSEFLFNKLSNPAFGLILDADNLGSFNRTMMRNRPGMMQPQNGRGYGNPQGNRGEKRGNWEGRNGMCDQGQGMQGRRGMNRDNRGFGQRGDRFMAMQNPEVKAKMLAYAKENIFPVINKERSEFDKNLSGSEKRIIEKARVQIGDLKKQMEGQFKQGRRGFRAQNDSARLAMRLKMDEAMLPVKQIALKHYGELEAVVGKLKQDFMGWGNGMRMAVAKDMNKPGARGQFRVNKNGMGQGKQGMNPRQGKPGFNQKSGMKKSGFIGPVKFLLYDPANPEASMPLMAQPESAQGPAPMK
ncbi:MAG: hypothetical protein JXR65_09765 [Bacteroidales bacterium]|nr:hypothetical protein [Bacteroidales bacterium]